MTKQGKRFIEDYLPIEALSATASSEPRTKGHISTVHPWRARRPLTACRAAIYAALVPACSSAAARKRRGEFIENLCIWDVSRKTVDQARQDILDASGGRAPRVLDMFAGGGSIPLEALRLGCDTVALDLNPVAFCILKASVDYPQRFGAELATDVRDWAKKISDRVQRQTRDLYPRIKVPDEIRQELKRQGDLGGEVPSEPILEPALFLWARTVQCPNRQCQAVVTLHRQTWLRRKPLGYIALRPRPDVSRHRTYFSVVHSDTEDGFEFDPSEGLRGTSTTCLCCHSTIPAKYVREYGESVGYGQQLLCVVAVNPVSSGKLYLVDDSWIDGEDARQSLAEERAAALEVELGVSLEAEIQPTGNAGLATGKSYLYGIHKFREAYTSRQRAVLLEFVKAIRQAYSSMIENMPSDRAEAITVYLGLWLSRLTDRFNALARWDNSRETVQSLTSMKRFAMMWDFPEVNLFGGGSGNAEGAVDYLCKYIEREAGSGRPATVLRGSATRLPPDVFADNSFDAVITDPPYYDNESYSELSDVFYLWLKPTVGHLFPEHFAGQLTPKRQECVAAAYRQGGTKDAAYQFFENCLAEALSEARRVLKASGVMVLIYAHKTTAGWASLVNALRNAGFEVVEAWPIETETKARVAHQDDASLASSIFLVARPRSSSDIGQFEQQVRPELERLARERVATLWADGAGLGGADLLMAAVGAGLRPYTQFSSVEYANGEPVLAESYLREVEGVVLETMLDEIFKLPRGGVASVDRDTRFYILWRFTYREAFVDAGEAFVFCYPQGVELEGLGGLSGDAPALVEKKETKFRVRSHGDRGNHDRLGVPADGRAAPLIDVLHRLLWLMENEPNSLGEFLREVQPNIEQLRLVAQALSGPTLTRADSNESPTKELSALRKLTANWTTLVELGALGGAALGTKKADRQLTLLKQE